MLSSEERSTYFRLSRTAVGLTVRELALEAGVSPTTIVRLERGELLKQMTMGKVNDIFQSKGVKLINSTHQFGIVMEKSAGETASL